MTNIAATSTWALLRGHLLRLGCPKTAPVLISPDVAMWTLDPSTDAVSFGWTVSGLIRLGRAFAIRGNEESRWVAYALAEDGVEPDARIAFVIEVLVGHAGAWLTVRLADTRAAVGASRSRWFAACEAMGLVPQAVAGDRGASGLGRPTTDPLGSARIGDLSQSVPAGSPVRLAPSQHGYSLLPVAARPSRSLQPAQSIR